MTSNLKERIMRRVYVIWALRQVFSPFMVKVYLVVAFAWELGRHVFVAEVFSNSPQLLHITDSGRFFVSAFTGTQWQVQLITFGLFIIGLFLFKDFISKVRFGSLAYLGRD